MAFTYPDDQRAIWQLLDQKDRILLAQSDQSCLWTLMKALDADDVTYGTDLAGQVMSLLADYDTKKAEIAATDDSVTREELYYEMEREFKENTSASALLGSELQSIRQEILAIVDPNACCVVPRVGAQAFG